MKIPLNPAHFLMGWINLPLLKGDFIIPSYPPLVKGGKGGLCKGELGGIKSYFRDNQAIWILIFLFFTVSLVSSSCAHRKKGGYHYVRKGETLWRISQDYGISLKELQEANGIKDPSRISVGQRLFMPTPPLSPPCEGGDKGGVVEPRHQFTLPLPGPNILKTDKKRFLWPVSGKITSGFGMRNGVVHKGIDILALEGTPVLASDKGVVIYSDNAIKSYGNMIIIKHGDGFSTVYAHNKVNLVKEKDKVKKGQRIATVGVSGNAEGPHVHFEIRKDNRAKNPFLFLP